MYLQRELNLLETSVLAVLVVPVVKGDDKKTDFYSEETEDSAQRQRNRRKRSRRTKDPSETIKKKTTNVAAQGVEDIPRRVSQIKDQTEIPSHLKKAAEPVERITRGAVEFFLGDDDNDDEDSNDNYKRGRPSKQDKDETDFVKEPYWYYVKKFDEPIDVRAEPIYSEEGAPLHRPRRQRSKPRGCPSNPYERDETVWGDPTVWRERGRASRKRRRQPSPTSPHHHIRQPPPGKTLSQSLFQLPPSSNSTTIPPPPSDNTDDKEPSASSSQEEGSPPCSEKPLCRNRKMDDDKRIYSTYDREERDAFDRFGNLIADAAEEVLWGKEEDEYVNGNGNDRDGRSTRNASSRSSQKIANGDENMRGTKKKRYWKDRLAEQVDYALGVHEDGRYYNNWQEKLDFDEQRRDGDDAISHFFARQKKGKRPKPDRRRHKTSTVPFWQEEGSIFSLLFGRTSSGENLNMHKFIEEDVGTTAVTTFFRMVLKSFFLLSSYTCRWASVRGALPQPFVVAGVAAAALSARPRQRLWTVALALVGMRTIGEMLHGYVYGDEGWDDEEDDIDSDVDRDSQSRE
mmetsp:Transcript_900/g.1284  ORF Transcript_900/g.1284 Transcript_900/m.1284 type:complete len:570 (-) Transcript_900:181-1890(-)